MRNLSALIIVLAIGLHTNLAAKPGDDIFNDTVLHEIRFEFTQVDYLDSLSYYISNSSTDDIPYMMVKVTIDNIAVDSVGVRYKGLSSFNMSGSKKSLKIDFNEYVSGKKYDELKKLNLNNSVGDPAMQREYICYDLLNSVDVPAPRISYAKVYFNGEYRGVYQVSEQIDSDFIDRHFNYADGNLFKNISTYNFEIPQDPSDISSYGHELKTNETENDWGQFINFIEVLNNTPEENFKAKIEEVFNVHLYLKALAVNVITNNADSDLENGQNWYMYEDSASGTFQWLPWDYNLALGGRNYINTTAKGSSASFSIDQRNSTRTLVNKILNVEEYYNAYIQYQCDIVNNKLDIDKYNEAIKRNKELIYNAVQADTVAVYPFSTFEKDMSDSGLSLYLAERKAELLLELNNLNACNNTTIAYGDIVINEFVASNNSASGIFDEVGQYDDWLELYNNTSSDIDLSNAYLTDNSDKMQKWQFPANTVIPAKGFLLIWADKDIYQPGLHSSFSLGKSGGVIILSNADESVIDQIMYGTQIANISYSRTTDGTGNFSMMTSTPGYSNTGVNAGENPVSDLSVYPNPANDMLFVSMDVSGSDNVSVNIHSVTGNIVIGEISVESGITGIDISHLQDGVYYLNVLSDRETHKTLKFVKF